MLKTSSNLKEKGRFNPQIVGVLKSLRTNIKKKSQKSTGVNENRTLAGKNGNKGPVGSVASFGSREGKVGPWDHNSRGDNSPEAQGSCRARKSEVRKPGKGESREPGPMPEAIGNMSITPSHPGGQVEEKNDQTNQVVRVKAKHQKTTRNTPRPKPELRMLSAPGAGTTQAKRTTRKIENTRPPGKFSLTPEGRGGCPRETLCSRSRF